MVIPGVTAWASRPTTALSSSSRRSRREEKEERKEEEKRGAECVVTVSSRNYVSRIDATTYSEKTRITTPNAPCRKGRRGERFTTRKNVSIADHAIARYGAAGYPFFLYRRHPDGTQVWFKKKEKRKREGENHQSLSPPPTQYLLQCAWPSSPSHVVGEEGRFFSLGATRRKNKEKGRE